MEAATTSARDPKWFPSPNGQARTVAVQGSVRPARVMWNFVVMVVSLERFPYTVSTELSAVMKKAPAE